MMSLGTNAIDAQREAYRRLGLVLTDEMIADAGAASDAFELLGMQFSARINAAIASNADELVTLGNALAWVAELAVDAAAGVGAVFGAIGETASGPLARAGNTVESVQAEIDEQNRRISIITGGGGVADLENARLREIYVALLARLETLKAAAAAEAAMAAAGLAPGTTSTGTPGPVLGAASPPVRPRAASPASPASSGPETIPTPNLHPQRQAEAFYDAMIALAATKGVQFANAQTKANIDAMDARRGEYREFFRSGFRDGILAALDGNAGEALSSWWREYITRAMSGILDTLADKVFDALSNSGGGSGIGSAIASIFGGTRAGGGPVSAGRAYTVGENGPERFVPRTAGRILPDRAPMGGAGQAAAPVVKLIVDEGTMFVARVEQISGPIAIQAGQGAYARASGDAARRAQAASYRLR